MADKAKAVAEKKITLNSLEEGIAKFSNAEEVKAAIANGTVVAEIDVATVDNDKFSGDYVRLSLGPEAKDDASVVAALKVICGGAIFVEGEKQDDGTVKESRKPSVAKFALYGSDLAARGKVSQQIKAAAQGPEKKIEQMVKLLMSMNASLSEDAAREQVALLTA